MTQIILNGESKTVDAKNIVELLNTFDYQSDKVAVAINGEFVPRSNYESQNLNENDSIEVLSAVQGG